MDTAKSNVTKIIPELTSVEKKLLECARSRKPTLLYGKLPIDVIAFVKNINDSVGEKWKHFDCSTLDGEDFYNKISQFHKAGNMTNRGSFYSESGTLFIDNLHYYPKKENEDENYNNAGKIIRNRKLTILSASPHFDPIDGFADKNDVYVNYESYAVVTHYDVDWIVVYTDKPDTFPSYFRRQFKEISLDGGSHEGEQQEERTVTESVKEITGSEGGQTVEKGSVDEDAITIDHKLLKYKDKKEKLEPIQIQLLKLLYENKDKLVTRNTILDIIWEGEEVYEKQITDHISKIKKAFAGLGFDKKIIETERKSRASEGGYIFHSNIVTLHFH